MKKLLIVGLVILLAGCEDASPSEDPVVFNYFPMEVGQYWKYDVEQVDYTVLNGKVEANYQLMSVVEDQYFLENGDEVFGLRDYTRTDVSAPWIPSQTWSATQDRFHAITTVNNVPIVIMSFPLSDNATWDGNAMNTNDADQYYAQDINMPYETELGDVFNTTVTVIQHDLLDVIVETDSRREVYADSVGLIYKESINLEYCTDPDCLGQQIIEFGTVYHQSIIEHGKN